MKQVLASLALITSVESVSAGTIPGNVVACYKSAVADLFEKPLTESLVRKYVEPEEVIKYLNIPENKQKHGLEKKVIQSVIAFAQFVKREIEKREDTTDESDLKFTFYKEYSTKIVVKGEIDGISFKVALDPNEDCKVLDFTLEGLKSMLDTVPRG